jgi:hypothetical protein
VPANLRRRSLYLLNLSPFAWLAQYLVQTAPSFFSSIKKSRSPTSLASHRNRGTRSRAFASKLVVKTAFGRFASPPGSFPL